MNPFRQAGLLAGAIALAFGLVACGDDDDVAEPAGAATTEQPANGGEVIEVEMADFEYRGLPDTIAAGTQISVVNSAASELHEIVVFKLADGDDRPLDDFLAMTEEEFGAALGGPPVMVLLAPPGGPQIAAVGDGTFTEPGRYLYFCAIPTGVEPAVYLAAAQESGGEQPQVEGGPPHFVHGMYGELTVQ